VAGIPITTLLNQEQIDNIVRRTREAGTEIVNLLGNGSAYFSSAASIMEMIEAYLGDKKRVISSSALCQGEYGIDGYYLGVPCVIGSGGLERILEIELTEEENAAFQETADAVRQSIEQTRL
jgi:malate dehydrogenase